MVALQSTGESVSEKKTFQVFIFNFEVAVCSWVLYKPIYTPQKNPFLIHLLPSLNAGNHYGWAN